MTRTIEQWRIQGISCVKAIHLRTLDKSYFDRTQFYVVRWSLTKRVPSAIILAPHLAKVCECLFQDSDVLNEDIERNNNNWLYIMRRVTLTQRLHARKYI